jgi:hypothetical protein
MTLHHAPRATARPADTRPSLTLVVDNTGPGPASVPGPAAAAVPGARPGPPPEFDRLVAAHGAAVYRAMGVRPRLRTVATPRSDSWWWDWAEAGAE